MKQKITFLILFCLLSLGLTAQTTYTVSSSLDDNSGGTLREVITAADPDDVIEIQEGLTITLSSAIAFDKGLTIRGLGDGATVKVPSQNSAWNVFIVGSGVGTATTVNYTVVLDNLDLQGGKAPGGSSSNGGVIFVGTANDSELCFTMRNCSVSKGTGNLGGGICFNNNTGIKNVILDNCIFFDNTGSSGSGGGGVVLRAAVAEVTNCQFRNNKAQAGVAILLGNANTTTATISNCTFEGNTGTANTKSAACISGTTGTVNINNCSFFNNTNTSLTATSLSVAAYSQNAGTAIFTNCTFHNNQGGQAGTIYAENGTIKFINCTFAGNVSTNTTTGGGAIIVYSKSNYTLVNCIFANNYNAAGANDIFQYSTNAANGLIVNDHNLLATEISKSPSMTVGITATDANPISYTGVEPLFAAYTTNDASQVIPELDATTGTIPLKNTSEIAIGTGATSYSGVTIPTTDQRGIPRKEIPDLGAYEYNYHNEWNSSATDNTWASDANWSNGKPILSDTAVINVNENNKYPALSANTAVTGVTVQPGASLDLANYTLSADVIKAQQRVAAKQWYSIGFPFAVNKIYSEFYDDDLDAGVNFWMKSHDNTGFTTVANYATPVSGTGYIIEFPLAFEYPSVISYSSGAVTGLAKGELTFTEDTYELQANPTLAPYAIDVDALSAANHYIYKLNSAGTEYNRITTNTSIAPFEAIITFESENEPPAMRVSLEGNGTTGITTVVNNDAVVATHYYNLQGIETTQPQRGSIYLVKKIFASGKSEVSKIIK
jgi:hypothetical protein